MFQVNKTTAADVVTRSKRYKLTYTTKQVILSASSPDDEALVLGAKYFGFEFANRIDSKAVVNTWDVTSPPPATKTSRSASSSSTTGGAAGTDMSRGDCGVAPAKSSTSISSHNSPPLSVRDTAGGNTPSEALSPDRSSSSIDAGSNPSFGEKDGVVRAGGGVAWEGASIKGAEGRGGGGDGAEVTRNSYEVRVLRSWDRAKHCVS